MKKISFRLWAIFFAILTVSYFSSCKDDSEPEPPKKSSDKALTNLKVIAGGTELTSSALQSDGKTFEFYVPMGFNEEYLEDGFVTFNVSPGAIADPKSESTVNLTDNVTIKVTAEDESSETYTLKRVDMNSSENAFLTFFLFKDTEDEIEGNIDNVKSIITFEYAFEQWELLVDAEPVFTLSPAATANYISGVARNFQEDVAYIVTANDGTERNWTVKRIDPPGSNVADIVTFFLFKDTPYEIEGEIDDENSEIYIECTYIFQWNLIANTAPTFTLSNGAKVDVASGVPRDFRGNIAYTVTAHDGTVRNWTVISKLPIATSGIRPGSATIMFEKRLNADLGITTVDLTGGIAVTGDYVIINTRNEKSIYIDAKTGEKAGEFDLGELKGNLRNFYTTADNTGNVVICNLSRNDGQSSDGTFKVWRLKNLNGDTELLIDWDNSDGTPPNIGRKLSIHGDLDGNAFITAPLLTEGGGALVQTFARWTVKIGELESQTPEIIDITGLEKGWNANADIVHTSATNVNSDYFLTAYQENALAWINGATNNLRNKVLMTTTTDAGNYVTNAVDYIQFNNAKYATLNWVNGQPWGSADKVWLVDVTSEDNFYGSLLEFCPAVVWECERGKYGGLSLTPSVQNINTSGAVALTVSPDGKFLYLYFMFTNGYVVGVQFDCIGM